MRSKKRILTVGLLTAMLAASASFSVITYAKYVESKSVAMCWEG